MSERSLERPRERIAVAPDVSLAAEVAEREAWLDLFAAAPPDVRRRFSLLSARIGGMGP